MNLRLKSSLFALACTLFVACSTEAGPPPELVTTYAHVLYARQRLLDTTEIQRTVDSIISANGYTDEEFQQELLAMSTTPELFTAFHDSVMHTLRAWRDSLHEGGR